MPIYNKLLKFQEKKITLEKDGVNPHFKNRYSTLNEVLGKIKEPLNGLGVVIVQTPAKEGLETRLVDTEDGDELVSLTPYIGVADMQKLGGAITYARRYALIAMLGLEDEDDDGNASVAPKKAPRSVQEAEGEPWTANTNSENDFKL